MQTISREKVIYAMSSANKEVMRCRTGETVVFETQDCFAGQIREENQTMATLDFDHTNPATGPLFVEEAQPGDILKVEILDIQVAERGVMCQIPGEGVTGALIEAEATRIVPVRNGKCLLCEREIPIDPMIGVIGVAPKKGTSISTGTPDAHGGNMDCNQIKKGSTLYLPVFVEGALLSMGDLHAVMGDGEVCVCGVEISGQVTCRVSVLHGALPTPFLVGKDRCMTIYSAPTLDEAAEGAVLRMQKLLGETLHMGMTQAGFLMSACGHARICQMVDPNKTVRMEIPREIFEDFLSRLENSL